MFGIKSKEFDVGNDGKIPLSEKSTYGGNRVNKSGANQQCRLFASGKVQGLHSLSRRTHHLAQLLLISYQPCLSKLSASGDECAECVVSFDVKKQWDEILVLSGTSAKLCPRIPTDCHDPPPSRRVTNEMLKNAVLRGSGAFSGVLSGLHPPLHAFTSGLPAWFDWLIFLALSAL